MKVIKKSRAQKGWSKEFDCTGSGNGEGGCGARLLVEQDDVFKTYHHCYDGSSDVYATFKCARCGVLTDIADAWRLPFLPREPRKSDSGATYTGSAGSGPDDER